MISRRQIIKTTLAASILPFLPIDAGAMLSPPLSTGFPSLDKACDGGMRFGKMYLVLGNDITREDTSPSVFSRSIVDNIRSNNKDLVSFSRHFDQCIEIPMDNDRVMMSKYWGPLELEYHFVSEKSGVSEKDIALLDNMQMCYSPYEVSDKDFNCFCDAIMDIMHKRNAICIMKIVSDYRHKIKHTPEVVMQLGNPRERNYLASTKWIKRCIPYHGRGGTLFKNPIFNRVWENGVSILKPQCEKPHFKIVCDMTKSLVELKLCHNSITGETIHNIDLNRLHLGHAVEMV